jgi:uncharacterized protein (TIGR02118 family)
MPLTTLRPEAAFNQSACSYIDLIQVDRDPAPEAGGCTPVYKGTPVMIKLVTLLKRQAGMTRKEFEWRWLNVHAPIAAVFPGLRGYVLSYSTMEGEPEADGVAQLWFDDRNGAQQSYATKIGRNGSEDASRHLSRRDHLLVSERWVGLPDDGDACGFKFMVGLKRPHGQSRADFVKLMNGLDRGMLMDGFSSDIVRVCVDEAGLQLNSGVDGALELFEKEAVFDGLIEAWYSGEASLDDAAAHYGQSEAGKFIEAASASREIFQLKENVIVTPPEKVQPARLLAGMNA